MRRGNPDLSEGEGENFALKSREGGISGRKCEERGKRIGRQDVVAIEEEDRQYVSSAERFDAVLGLDDGIEEGVVIGVGARTVACR